MLGSIELFVKPLKEGQNLGFDPFWRKLSIKTSLTCHVLKAILKVGWNIIYKPWTTNQLIQLLVN